MKRVPKSLISIAENELVKNGYIIIDRPYPKGVDIIYKPHVNGPVSFVAVMDIAKHKYSAEGMPTTKKGRERISRLLDGLLKSHYTHYNCFGMDIMWMKDGKVFNHIKDINVSL